MNQNQLDYSARIIGNSVHDLSKIWSGYVSYNGLKSILNNKETFSSLASDHYKSRLQSGKQIINLFQKFEHIPFDYFSNIIFEACFVHKILKTENSKLIKSQSSGLVWSKCYIDCGIDLIFLGDDSGILPDKITKRYLNKFEHLIKKEEN